jgi:hypothetical protein
MDGPPHRPGVIAAMKLAQKQGTTLFTAFRVPAEALPFTRDTGWHLRLGCAATPAWGR